MNPKSDVSVKKFALTAALSMTPQSEVSVKKSALAPALSPGKRGKFVSASVQNEGAGFAMVQGFNARMY